MGIVYFKQQEKKQTMSFSQLQKIGLTEIYIWPHISAFIASEPDAYISQLKYQSSNTMWNWYKSLFIVFSQVRAIKS